ncbi:hypothetical protein M231_04730 [Tremella mesenterica]|uniref:Uncharacterized protein n=1 Tax=Tremella mesenterica TaxID=5217 RepID=A0A4Q1BJP4_TREME|nr:hypothetical protein M231_04730 [Tremella mesenterica]
MPPPAGIPAGPSATGEEFGGPEPSTSTAQSLPVTPASAHKGDDTWAFAHDAPLLPGDGRRFWMTDCFHVICDDKSHENKKGVCTYCKKQGIKVFSIHAQEPQIMLGWFSNSSGLFRAMERDLASADQALKSAKLRSDQLRYQNSQLERQVRKLRKETVHQAELMKSTQSHMLTLAAVQKELEKVKKEKDELQSIVNKHLVTQYNNGTPFVQASRLATVEEADESLEGETYDTGESNKRQRVSIAYTPKRFLTPASVGHHIRSNGTSTPVPGVLGTRTILPRSSTVPPGLNRLPRNNISNALQHYRFDQERFQTSTPLPHATSFNLHRDGPSAASTSGTFTDGLRVNGQSRRTEAETPAAGPSTHTYATPMGPPPLPPHLRK